MAAKTVGAERRVGGGFGGAGFVGDEIHGAGAGAEAEEIGVGAAGDFDGADVVEIEGDLAVAGEIAPRVIDAAAARAGGTDPADAIGAGRIALNIVADATGAVRGELREIIRALGAGLVAEEVVDIEDGGVLHLLFGDDRDGGAEVLEFRVEARAGGGVEGLVALVVFDDREGREQNGLVGFI